MSVSTATGSAAVLEDVSYRYPRAEGLTLDHVDWRIQRGDFIVVTGPSGSGKSTMLRCLNGLVPHFSGGRFGGETRVFGYDTRLNGPRTMSAHVGFVFQDPEAQSVARIVEDDIAFGLEQAGLPRFEMRKRVEEVLDLLGIALLRNRDITTLSGGERQRVAIAGAMARRPDLLVLDEPTSQLDPWGADEVLTSLQRLNDDLGLTVVLAEHRLDRVAHAADSIRIVRSDGSIVDAAPAHALSLLPERDQPPLAQFAERCGWAKVPLTIKEARRSLATPLRDFSPPTLRDSEHEALVRIDGLSIDRGSSRVLHDLCTVIASRQITALMGRNGAGKSTLIRALLGMLPITSGRIEIAGRNIAFGSTRELVGIAGYLPQDPARLLFAESVIDELNATLSHLPPGHERRDPHALLAELDLSHLAERHPRDLSTGERERVALAAVIVSAPKLLLLDEPTRGMDGTRKHRLMQILDRERARGCAIVMATHDVELVANWSDRVMLLGNAEIVADGTAREVLAGSVTFSPAMNRLFGGKLLTVDDAVSMY